MNEPSPSPFGRAAVAVAIAVAVGALYSPARTHGFLQLDDNEYVTENAAVRAGLSRESASWALTAYHSGHWHPLTWLSLMADVERAGVDAGPMHTTSVAMHAAGTALLFLALSCATGTITFAALAALLFAVHPLRVESVAWVATRKDVLSGLFVMATIWAWAAYARRESVLRYLVALAAFACALVSKPTVVVVPCGLLLLDWWPLRRLAISPPPDGLTSDLALRPRSVARAIAEKLPFLLLAALTLRQTWAAQNAAGAVTSQDALPLAARLANAAWNYALYVARTVWPFDLGVFYPLQVVPAEKAFAAAALILLTTWLFYRQREARPWRLAGWLWFCGMLVPVSGIVQFGGQSIADRYSYLPHIGLALGVAFEIAWQARRASLSPASASFAAGALVASLALLSWRQLDWWTDSVKLLSHTIDVTGPNFFAENNLGVALELAGRYDEAAPHYELAARLNPSWPEALNNYGIVLAKRGRTAEAIEHFERALAVRPTFARAHNNLATALGSIGRPEEAFAHFARAVELDPWYVEARVALAQMLEQRGDLVAAEEQLIVAARQSPGDASIAAMLARVRNARGAS